MERNLKCICVNWIKQYVSEKFGKYIKLVSFQVIPPIDYPCVSSAAMGRITWSNSIKPKGLYWTFEHVPTRIYTFRLHSDTYITGKKHFIYPYEMHCSYDIFFSTNPAYFKCKGNKTYIRHPNQLQPLLSASIFQMTVYNFSSVGQNSLR